MTLQALATLQQPAPTMAARDLKLTLDALDQDMKNVKAMITGPCAESIGCCCTSRELILLNTKPRVIREYLVNHSTDLS